MIRVAAVGDVHFGLDSAGTLRPHIQDLPQRADMLLLAGDVTRHGDPDEAGVLAEELEDLSLPIVAVLGNHDYHLDQEAEIAGKLERAGVRVLEGAVTTIDVGDVRVGIAGVKGFGGGFVNACGTEFGEPEMKAFIRHTKQAASRLEAVLSSLVADLRIVLLHYSPVQETLVGEPPQIFPFLGSYLLAEAADRVGADLILHGHAHRGTERGRTPGGIPVRNVAYPLIERACNLYCLNGSRARLGCEQTRES